MLQGQAEIVSFEQPLKEGFSMKRMYVNCILGGGGGGITRAHTTVLHGGSANSPKLVVIGGRD